MKVGIAEILHVFAKIYKCQFNIFIYQYKSALGINMCIFQIGNTKYHGTWQCTMDVPWYLTMYHGYTIQYHKNTMKYHEYHGTHRTLIMYHESTITVPRKYHDSTTKLPCFCSKYHEYHEIHGTKGRTMVLPWYYHSNTIKVPWYQRYFFTREPTTQDNS